MIGLGFQEIALLLILGTMAVGFVLLILFMTRRRSDS